jgi:hypothetical protein
MPETEGLYVVEFGDVSDIAPPGTYRNGGVAVLLETNRVFGGDSGYYYVGDYSVYRESIVATIKIVKHDPNWSDAFGDTAESFTVKMQAGPMSAGVIEGSIERTDIPGVKLPVRLTWRERLS